MIQFACPGCGASYSVGDDKAGKSGKCPKCQAQFRIPDPEPVAPSAPVSDAAIEIAPCPKCRARLSVPSEDLGAEVECPYCQTVYVAKRFDVPSLPPRPSSRPADDEDRPSRRSRYDKDDVRTRRDSWDDEEDEPRPRRRRRSSEPSGAVSLVGILNYILGGLAICCSGCLFVLGTVSEDLIAEMKKEPNFNDDIEPDLLAVVCFGMGAGYLLYAVMLLIAGMGVTARKTYGRILTFLTGGASLLLMLLSFVNAAVNLVDGNAPGVCGAVVMALVLGGYGCFALFTMIKHGDEFS